jgi:hypothetical protein
MLAAPVLLELLCSYPAVRSGLAFAASIRTSSHQRHGADPPPLPPHTSALPLTSRCGDGWRWLWLCWLGLGESLQVWRLSGRHTCVAWAGRCLVHCTHEQTRLFPRKRLCSLPVSTIQHHIFFRIAGHFLELSRYADSMNETVSCQPIIPLPDCPPWTNYFSSATLKPYTNPLLHCGSSSSGVGIARGCRKGLTPCAPPTNKIMFTELRDGHKFTIGCMCHNVVLPTCQYSTVLYRRGAWY